MAWTTPITWTNSAVVGATEMNEQIRDNMNFLFAPTFDMIVTAYTAVAQVTGTASTAVPITAGLSSEITTFGGNIHCYFQSWVSGSWAMFYIDYNGTSVSAAGVSGLVSADDSIVIMNAWITGLASGTHVITPMWSQAGGNVMRLLSSGNPVTWWVREG